jgi:hypothetical protein
VIHVRLYKLETLVFANLNACPALVRNVDFMTEETLCQGLLSFAGIADRWHIWG